MDELIIGQIERRGYRVERVLKPYNKEIGKSNAIAFKDDSEFFIKVFGGFKRKYLRKEQSIREILRSLGFPGMETGDIFEAADFTFLAIPYIRNAGTLQGREHLYLKELIGLADRLHSVPVSLLDVRPYRPITDLSELGERFPHTEEMLRGMGFLKKTRTVLERILLLSEKPHVFSHNDFNGDNILINDAGALVITDFEQSSPNYELEDFSKLSLFNAIERKCFFDDNNIHRTIVQRFGREDATLFLLYQSIKYYEYLSSHPNVSGFLEQKNKYLGDFKKIVSEGIL